MKQEKVEIESGKKAKKFQDHTGMALYILKDQPLTFEEVLSEFKKMEMSLSFNYRHFFEPRISQRSKKRRKTLKKALDFLEEAGLIDRIKAEDKYSITEVGKEDLKKFDKSVKKVRTTIDKVLNPKYSPIGSLIVHFVIGILKLMGFFFTGSVGLLGDGLDSSVDALSSIVVSIAMKNKKEKQASYLLILLMCGSGLMIIYESTVSLLNPEPLSNGIFGIIVTSISIIFCFFLYLYQRVVGYFKRNLTVLAQSEDSKNHVIVGFLVLVGVILGSYKLDIVDSIVGVLIGLLILRGSYELFQDIRAASRGEDVDYEKYKVGFWRRFESTQKQLLNFWVVWKIDSGYQNSKSLAEEFEKTFNTKLHDFMHLEIQRETEDKKIETERISASKQIKDLNQTIERLKKDNFISIEKENFFLTQTGKKYLNKKMEKLERRRH